MNYRAIFLIFTLLLAIPQCVSSNKQCEQCEKNNHNSIRCLNEFIVDNDISHLDSALFYIDEIFGKCTQYDLQLAMRKLGIYSYKSDMYKAILFIDSLDCTLFYLPYYKNLLLNRFKAMSAQEQGDILNRNVFLSNIIIELEQFISSNKDEINAFMQLSNISDILQHRYNIVPMQLYYYKAQIDGIDKIEYEIDSLQRSINGNEKYFEIMKEYLHGDFMYFGGF
jgi:hypothetical protein